MALRPQDSYDVDKFRSDDENEDDDDIAGSPNQRLRRRQRQSSEHNTPQKIQRVSDNSAGVASEPHGPKPANFGPLR
jgi:hypothetical protein